MARRRDPQPHPVDPSRRRRIEDPAEYERGKRDGQADQDKTPDTDKDTAGGTP